MNGFEWNKLAAAICIAGIIFMLAGYLTDAIYHPEALSQPKIAGLDNIAPTGASAQQEVKEIVIGQLMSRANVEKGKSNFKKCASCHSAEKDGGNRVGPNLWDVVGRNIASHAGYNYSQVFQDHKGSWGYEELYHYLSSPKKFIPGNKMAFVGLQNPEDVADMIAYLRGQSDNPKPLP